MTTLVTKDLTKRALGLLACHEGACSFPAKGELAPAFELLRERGEITLEDGGSPGGTPYLTARVKNGNGGRFGVAKK